MTIAEVISHPGAKQWLPGILNGVMLLLLTASLAQWTWFMVKPPLPPLVMAPPPPVSTTSTFSVEPLLAAHLFGQASEELTGGRLDNLPISSLNLVLTGVIAAAGGGYALISVNNQPQEPFAIGQNVTAGAVLQAVYPDRVVIQRNGALESLLLEGADKPAPGVEASAPMPSYTPAQAPGNVVQETSSNHYAVQREQLAAQMRTPDFLRQATMTPAGGGGFRVQQLQPGSLYEKLGLRAGDVIKSVNGQAINSAEDAIRLYQQIGNVESAQIEVMRGGKPEYLYYDFSQNP